MVFSLHMTPQHQHAPTPVLRYRTIVCMREHFAIWLLMCNTYSKTQFRKGICKIMKASYSISAGLHLRCLFGSKSHYTSVKVSLLCWYHRIWFHRTIWEVRTRHAPAPHVWQKQTQPNTSAKVLGVWSFSFSVVSTSCFILQHEIMVIDIATEASVLGEALLRILLTSWAFSLPKAHHSHFILFSSSSLLQQPDDLSRSHYTRLVSHGIFFLRRSGVWLAIQEDLCKILNTSKL